MRWTKEQRETFFSFKALASLKQNVRKYNKDFESMIANCRENPDEYNEEEDEEEEEEEEKDEDGASEGGKANKLTSCDQQQPLLISPTLFLLSLPLFL